MNLQSIRTQLLQHGYEVFKTDAMIRGADQPERACGQTAPAAIATILNDSTSRINGIGGTNRLAGPWTIRRAVRRIKRSFTEMGISTVADADHQPRETTGSFKGPSETDARRSHHGKVSRHIDTVDTRHGIQSAEIGNGRKVLIARTTNQLDPTPLRESVVTGQVSTGGIQSKGGQTPRS